MANFTPVSAAIGGALIGLSAVLLMLSTGRIAGVSGIFSGLLNLRSEDKGWRIAFIAGLILAPVIAGFVGYGMAPPKLPAELGRPCRGRTAGRLRHTAWRRLHLRTRHLRNRAAVAALHHGHDRLHGDGGVTVAVTHHVLGG